MVGDASDAQGFAVQISYDGGEGSAEIRANCGCKHRRTTLCGEDDMGQEIGEGLWHGNHNRSGFRSSSRYLGDIDPGRWLQERSGLQPSVSFLMPLTPGYALGWYIVAPLALNPVGNRSFCRLDNWVLGFPRYTRGQE